MDEEPEVPEPFAEVEGQVAALLYRPVTGGVGGDSAEVHPAGTVLDEHQHVQPGQRSSIHVQEIDSQDPAACARRNCRQVGPSLRGAGSMPAPRRISYTVDAATETPSLVSSP